MVTLKRITQSILDATHLEVIGSRYVRNEAAIELKRHGTDAVPVIEQVIGETVDAYARTEGAPAASRRFPGIRSLLICYFECSEQDPSRIASFVAGRSEFLLAEFAASVWCYWRTRRDDLDVPIVPPPIYSLVESMSLRTDAVGPEAIAALNALVPP